MLQTDSVICLLRRQQQSERSYLCADSQKVTGDAVASYIHGGGRIGVVIAADGASDDAAKEALTNIAMQVAAMNPQYISRNDISAEELAKIKEITIDSALNDATTLPKPILTSYWTRQSARRYGVMRISITSKSIRAI